MSQFYVYIYLDPRKPGKYEYGDFALFYEPLYVGKGSYSRRWREHLCDCNLKQNNLKNNKLKKILNEGHDIENYIVIIPCISEKHSFDVEIKLITEIGRYDSKEGPLTNMTDGGDGRTGWTDQQKKENSERVKQWNKDNPEKYEEKKRKAAKSRRTDEFRKRKSEQTSQWIKDNPTKWSEIVDRRIEACRTDEFRENSRRKTIEWIENNSEAQQERLRKTHNKVRENNIIKRDIIDKCKEIILKYNIIIELPHFNNSLKKWKEFLDLLNAKI